jgi:predicted nucleic acid-binding protein
VHSRSTARAARRHCNTKENARRLPHRARKANKFHRGVQKSHLLRTKTKRKTKNRIARRNEIDLENDCLTVGIDTNILCYALDPAYPEHNSLRHVLIDLSEESTIALNPTILHETYHVLVFYLEWQPEEAAGRLSMLLKHPYVQFFNQTKKTTQIALHLSVKHNLGGRDALILANFLSNKIQMVLTHDQKLMHLERIAWRDSTLVLKDPLIQGG